MNFVPPRQNYEGYEPVDDTYVVPKGMPLEIFIDKYSRKKADGTYQSWAERISEVVDGNFTLEPRPSDDPDVIRDKALSHELGRRGVYVLSGRHLQHGDLDQANKAGELFTNCSTSLFTWSQFWLLMKGSGVGRSYDSGVHFVDWDYMPNCRFVLSQAHPDYQDWIESLEEAQHKYDTESEDVRWFDVEDSAEGWVKMLIVMETAAFHKRNRDNTFVFNLTPVRGKGTPIKGQQNRPASGPVPLIKAMHQVSRIKGLGWKPWKQAMFIDHYLSACVMLGGVRRSARMSTKSWRDRDVLEFIDIKRGGWLYTSNNSITVDAEFWEQARDPRPSKGRRVFEAAIQAAYYDQTGEPGFINLDKLTWSNADIEGINAQTFLNPDVIARFGSFHEKTYSMTEYMLSKAKAQRFPFIVNPCAEIVLAVYGGYCIVGDTCLAYAKTRQDALDGVRMVAQSLVRTNLMKFLYQAETDRTNRIGVSLIGIFEFAWNVFGLTFPELVTNDPTYRESIGLPALYIKPAVERFWAFMEQIEQEVANEVARLAAIYGIKVPHTYLTMKPGGTTPKVMNCTEAANLPAMDFYLRWVQYNNDHPALADFAARGYPVRDISRAEQRTKPDGTVYTVNGYANTSIVGFPTRMEIAAQMGDQMTTIKETTIEQQYAWLRLLERHLLGGEGKGNQISITIKYDPQTVSYQEFMQVMLDQQSSIRCCAVMPQEDASAYIYTPEERITGARYYELMSGINAADREAVDISSLDCEGGACGIDASVNASIDEEMAGVGAVEHLQV